MTSTKIDLKQRENLVSLLREAKQNEKGSLEKQNPVSVDSILREYADSKGHTQMVKDLAAMEAQIRDLNAKHTKVEASIEALGFEISGSEFRLHWRAPNVLRTTVSKKLEEAHEPIEKSLKKYDLAIAQIWTANSGEELKKVVEGLI